MAKPHAQASASPHAHAEGCAYHREKRHQEPVSPELCSRNLHRFCPARLFAEESLPLTWPAPIAAELGGVSEKCVVVGSQNWLIWEVKSGLLTSHPPKLELCLGAIPLNLANVSLYCYNSLDVMQCQHFWSHNHACHFCGNHYQSVPRKSLQMTCLAAT